MKWNPDSPLHPVINETTPNTNSESSSVTSANETSPEHSAKQNKPAATEVKTKQHPPLENSLDRFSIRSKGVNASVGEESMLTLFSAMLHRFVLCLSRRSYLQMLVVKHG